MMASVHNISTDHIEIDIHDDPESHNIIITTAAGDKQLDGEDKALQPVRKICKKFLGFFRLNSRREVKARQSARKICKKILGFIRLKSRDNGQRRIHIPCISQVVKWFHHYFVNTWTLEELVQISGDDSLLNGNSEHLELKKILGDAKLIDQLGRPTSLLVDLLRDIVSQLIRLHKSGKTHGNLKPENVVIIQGIRRLLCAKLSVDQNTTSLSHYSNDCGLEDMFSLGCLLFFCITGGKHPFGDHDPYYRDENINVENKVDLFLVEDFPEAHHLFTLLLCVELEKRPKAIEVLNHPLMWKSWKRLRFLRDISDLLKKYSALSDTLDAATLRAIGANRVARWDQTMDKDIINHMSKYKTYKFNNVPHLLRFIRNMFSHYKETPEEIKGLMTEVRCDEDLDRYFTRRFPKLLMTVYNAVYTHCKDEKDFEEYFKGRV